MARNSLVRLSKNFAALRPHLSASSYCSLADCASAGRTCITIAARSSNRFILTSLVPAVPRLRWAFPAKLVIVVVGLQIDISIFQTANIWFVLEIGIYDQPYQERCNSHSHCPTDPILHGHRLKMIEWLTARLA